MSTSKEEIGGYGFANASPAHTHAYLLPTVLEVLEGVSFSSAKKRVFDLGCGNDSTAYRLTKEGYTVAGVDPSTEGIAQANRHYPALNLSIGSAYDDLETNMVHFQQ